MQVKNAFQDFQNIGSSSGLGLQGFFKPDGSLCVSQTEMGKDGEQRLHSLLTATQIVPGVLLCMTCNIMTIT